MQERSLKSLPQPHPDDAYLGRLDQVQFDPIFIIGDHRSGTTLLYQLLSLTGAFNVLTAYHVIRYDQILADHVSGQTGTSERALATEFSRQGLSDRAIDGVRVTPDLPEEYGFLLEGSRPQISPAMLPRLIEIGRKLRFVGSDRPVLLKNPWDVFHFAYLDQVFPRAKFIFIHRHPLNVMHSQLEASRVLFAARNGYVAFLSGWYRSLFDRPIALRVTRLLSTAAFGIGARIVGRHVAKVARYYLSHIGALNKSRYVEIRYEDLCTHPDAIIDRLLTFFQVPAARTFIARDLVRPRTPRVSAEVRERYRTIRPAFDAYCAMHGYDLDP